MISFIPAFVVALLVAILHRYGASSGLYTATYYYDLLMHFLGGFFIGYSAIWLFLRANVIDTKTYGLTRWNMFKLGLLALAVIGLVGIGWEIFEYIHGLTDHSPGETYWSDTLVDIVMDISGALFAWMWVRFVTCCRGCRKCGNRGWGHCKKR